MKKKNPDPKNLLPGYKATLEFSLQAERAVYKTILKHKTWRKDKGKKDER